MAKNAHDKALQRALLQYYNPKNYALCSEALHRAHRTDLIGNGPKCLIPAAPPGGRPGDRSGGKAKGACAATESRLAETIALTESPQRVNPMTTDPEKKRNEKSTTAETVVLFGAGNRGRTCTVAHRSPNPACLPIPPYPHNGSYFSILCQKIKYKKAKPQSSALYSAQPPCDENNLHLKQVGDRRSVLCFHRPRRGGLHTCRPSRKPL